VGLLGYSRWLFQVIGPIAQGGFTASDFTSLVAYESRRRVEPLLKALEEAGFSSKALDKSVHLFDQRHE
jgi:hypothetical protein